MTPSFTFATAIVALAISLVSVVAALTLIRSDELEADLVPEPETELALDAA